MPVFSAFRANSRKDDVNNTRVHAFFTPASAENDDSPGRNSSVSYKERDLPGVSSMKRLNRS